ncbi:MAG TPA: AMP-binding protein, partial [Ktedonobacterales bacterium]|nr:AMP-binding protein [Ktedonobacterales bacterium]
MGSAKPLALRYVVFGGEALNLPSLQSWFNRHGDQMPRLINMYGITETTVHVTYRPLTEADTHAAAASLIGCAIPDLSLYVLDGNLQPAPVGVPGEMYVGGAGLARGYLNRPDLTVERFIPHPFSADPDARLYRTGDLARYHANGDLEYLGRIDHQVKVRGYRIELGEIEAVLAQHPAVREAIVMVQGDAMRPNEATDDAKRLIAYVTRKQRQEQEAEQPTTEWLAEQVAQWQEVFNGIYHDPANHDDPTFNSIGWDSSYTNKPIPDEEMHEWVDRTVERILDLQPKRVLEIGCGTGLMLFRVAPTCEQYWGSDFSPEALDKLRTQVADQSLSQVTLLQREASDFTAPLAEQRRSFDVVIINSVVQYFPGIDYLVRVLEGALDMVAPGGAIFVGDVRNLRLLETFHTSVQLRQAPLSLLGEQLRQRVQRRVEQENELVIDPAFFTALQRHLPRISHVEAQIKRGRYHNELTRFRYDVTLHVERDMRPVSNAVEMDWQQDQLSVAALRQMLDAQQPEILSVKHIPNARLLIDAQATALLAGDTVQGTVGQLWQIVRESTQEAPGVDPEELWSLGNASSYAATIVCSEGAADWYDVTFIRRDALPAGRSAALPVLASVQAQQSPQPWRAYATDPLAAKAANSLVPMLRDYLKRRMPDYMIPAVIMALDALPLTPNGKIDRRALPSPDGTRPELKSAFVAPRNAAEQLLAEIWSEVLGIDQVGIHDNFFELGGDSLMSIRVIARAGKAGMSITAKQIFQHQTIAQLAAVAGTSHIQAEQGPVTGPMHLFPAHRFTFGARMGDPLSHSLTYLLENPEPLDPALMESVLRYLLIHHDALRVRATERDGEWDLFVAGPDEVAPLLWQVDLSGLPEVEQVSSITSVLRDLALHFDLARDPLLRAALCYLGEGKPTPLVVAGHSLVVDMQSWQFLMEDLQTTYGQISQ